MSSKEQRSNEENQGVNTASPKMKDPPSYTPLKTHHPVQLDSHHQRHPYSTSFSASMNEEKISSISEMNTGIGVNTLHHSGVNSSANIGDSSMFDHGVNTMSKIGVNNNIMSGDNTSKISCYKEHKAKRTYTKRKERIGVNTSSSSDNRYSKAGTRNVKSRICLLLLHNPSAKIMYSAVIKNWINFWAKEMSMGELRLFLNTSCSGIYETPGIEWNIFHQVIMQCVCDKLSHSLL